MLPFVGTLVLLLFVYLKQGQSIAAASVQGPCELESILPKPILESSLSCIASVARWPEAGYSVSSRMGIATAERGLAFLSVLFLLNDTVQRSVASSFLHAW